MDNRKKLGRKATPVPGPLGDLLDVVWYDPETGLVEVLYPRLTTGTVNKAGYRLLRYVPMAGAPVYLRADHIAWLMMTDEWPEGWIEHVNGLHDDNTISNLIHVDEDFRRWWVDTRGEKDTVVEVTTEVIRTMTDKGVVVRPLLEGEDFDLIVNVDIEVQPKFGEDDHFDGPTNEDLSDD